jgi:L-asparaginase
MHITFIQAGGTIDKDYPRGETDHGYEFHIGEPAVRSILPTVHGLFSYDIVEVVKKDSLDIDEEDRKKIYDAVKNSAADKVVITHGTDTIGKTAEYLDSLSGKTIVLTGAMLPEKFSTSDAKFNLGMAVAAAEQLPHGVYVALYGRVVEWKKYSELALEYEKTRRED